MPLGVGETFADYRVVRRLGAGGMGEVYLVEHPRLPRRDALKLLAGNVSTDNSFRERFLREADLASTLWHPHIVGVHDRGEHNGQLWITMDFVDGEDASSLLDGLYRDGMPRDTVVSIVKAVGSALDYAHKQGLLHRDVKPANIMLGNADDTGERRILLADFGIARSVHESSGLTATNTTVGTVFYIAPEQLMGENVDGRADQYSLAATAYHLLTGSPPFRDTNPAVVIGRHLSAAPPLLGAARPELADLDGVFAAALAKDPAMRFASCTEFARALAGEGARRTAPAPTAPPMAATAMAPIPTYPAPSSPPSSYPPAYPHVAAAGAPKAGVPPVVWFAVAVVVAVAVIAVALVMVGGGSDEPDRQASSTRTSDSVSDAGDSVPTPDRPKVDVNIPDSPVEREPSPPSPPAPPPPPRQVVGVVVGTCDEGGSCGVRQRNAPLTDAPNLYSSTLRDGTSVTIACQTTGDTRTSAGYGSSSTWYRLDNGAYINSVYISAQASQVPTC